MSDYKKLDTEVLKYAVQADATKLKDAMATALSARIVDLSKERFS